VAWENQNKSWHPDLSNKNYERQTFHCCRSMGSWEFKWGTEDKVNKICSFCINCTLWLFAEHGLDNAFFWKCWNMYGWKICRKLNNLNTNVNLGGESQNGRHCWQHQLPKQFLQFHCYKVGNPSAPTVTWPFFFTQICASPFCPLAVVSPHDHQITYGL
jgi:hypothetical protein